MFVPGPIKLLEAEESETVLVSLCIHISEKINCKSWFKKVVTVL